MTATEQAFGDANGVSGHRNDRQSAQASEPLIPDEPIDLASLCARAHAVINDFLERDAETPLLKQMQIQTRKALNVIHKSLETYSLPELSLSYNGGKDCLVLLVLYLYGLHDHNLRTSVALLNNSDARSDGVETSEPIKSIQSVYIKSPHPFLEVEEFVEASERIYSLSLQRYVTPMKSAFASYLADNPSVKAIFVGTRRTDPHGAALTHFDATDRGWPAFMRIHPVIDWHYVEIWSFIKYFRIPYCVLYDMGYTSLGGTDDTLPNPALRLPASTTQEPKFLPAHELVLDEEERLGRERKANSTSEPPVHEKKNLF